MYGEPCASWQSRQWQFTETLCFPTILYLTFPQLQLPFITGWALLISKYCTISYKQCIHEEENRIIQNAKTFGTSECDKSVIFTQLQGIFNISFFLSLALIILIPNNQSIDKIIYTNFNFSTFAFLLLSLLSSLFSLL